MMSNKIKPIILTFCIFILSFIVSSAITLNVTTLLEKFNFSNLVFRVLLNDSLFLLMIYLLFYFTKIELKKPEFHKVKLNDLFLIPLVIFSTYFVMFLIVAIFGNPNEGQRTAGLLNDNGMLSAFLIAVIIAPFFEEIIFRYIIREVIKDNFILFVVLSSFLFGLIHLQISNDFYSSIYPLIGTSCLAVFQCLIYKRSNYNLSLIILSHSTYNFIVMFLIMILQMLLSK